MRPLFLALLAHFALAACISEPSEGFDPFANDPWRFSSMIEMRASNERGHGGLHLCRPVTSMTRSIGIEVTLTPEIAVAREAKLRVLIFEADPFFADGSADCVGGGIVELDTSPTLATFTLPADRDDLRYYVAVSADTDGDGDFEEGCSSYAQRDFGGIEKDAARVKVDLAPQPCR